jgi:hypothetical protein
MYLVVEDDRIVVLAVRGAVRTTLPRLIARLARAR